MMMINDNVESLSFKSSSFGGNTDIDALTKNLSYWLPIKIMLISFNLI